MNPTPLKNNVCNLDTVTDKLMNTVSKTKPPNRQQSIPITTGVDQKNKDYEYKIHNFKKCTKKSTFVLLDEMVTFK